MTAQAHFCEIDSLVLFGALFGGCCWRCWFFSEGFACIKPCEGPTSLQAPAAGPLSAAQRVGSLLPL